MAKFSEIGVETRNNYKAAIDEFSDLIRSARQESWKRVMNYLFALNAGSLAGALTYVASRTATSDMLTAIKCFTVGIILLYLHAAIDYYQSEFRQKDFFSDLTKFYEDDLDWDIFIQRTLKRKSHQAVLHIIGLGQRTNWGLWVGHRHLCAYRCSH
jgi:hypothetical protein